MRYGFFLAIIAALSLNACGHATTPSPVGAKDRAISASVPVDGMHRLALRVGMGSRPSTTAGLTRLAIAVFDARERFVNDAIVYVRADSATGDTPRVTVVATRERDAYRVDLPLVFGSHWSFSVRAYSGGRNASLSVEEQLD